ncbi:TadA family conjugal transfer-associated ATPase [Ornithinimicrobium pekingense]|uniref:Pilus assembly protein CpaF n=1 Tax=Ornithinimicrobium pekingense TaxID=384677 RepID=A0ABQ2F4B1_9MICO|nr:TadA family conjugal transfer-associated ATPase [Ornithinimicrobium pekingense]GGK57801.1 pilus assembly protein CpaF [Ornithinimicrobium pekingense]
MTVAQDRAAVAGALGPLTVHLEDDRVTDILVNGGAGVWVDRGNGVEAVESALSDERTVRRLAVRLAGLAGQRLDDASPWVDGLLPGGIRLHAVLPPLVSGGAHVSLRVPRRAGPSLDDLSAWGALDGPARQVLEAVVAARVSFVVSGGTGSGKTTVLAAMLARVPGHERVAVVEDVRELHVDHPHVVHLQGRGNNVEGRGEVTLTTLVRQSLRMRPDRVVVGEVRGAEVRELLAALNTGHEGGCGTLHANAAADVVSRVEALGALAGMSPAAVHAQLASAIEVVLHVVRRSDGRRVLGEVAVLEQVSGVVRAVPALLGGPERWSRGPAWGQLSRRLGLSADQVPDVQGRP